VGYPPPANLIEELRRHKPAIRTLRWQGKPRWLSLGTEPIWQAESSRNFHALDHERTLSVLSRAECVAPPAAHLMVVAPGPWFGAGASPPFLARYLVSTLTTSGDGAARPPDFLPGANGGHKHGPQKSRRTGISLDPYIQKLIEEIKERHISHGGVIDDALAIGPLPDVS